MESNTLRILTVNEFKSVYKNLTGYASSKDNSESIRVYDNWINRIALDMPVQKSCFNSITHTQEEQMVGLKDFQRNDVIAMINNYSYLNRNKMGSGKTIEFIVACKCINASSIIVVALKPTILQWVAQFKKWWPERENDVVVYDFGYTPKRGDIVILNPEKLTSSKSNGKFNHFVWDVIGVDEAHIIKNRSTKRTIAIKSIPAQRKYALTGSPVLRNPDDLFSIFEFLNPKIAGRSYWNFAEYFCTIEEDFYGRHINGLTKNQEHVDILKKILKECSCYNELQLAEGKQKIVVPLEMEARQRGLYNKIRKLLLQELPDTITVPNGAVRVIRLLQTTSCPAILDSEEDQSLGTGVKFEYILGMLEADPTLKMIVYSKFERVIAQLHAFLTKNGIGCATYTGKMGGDEREIAKNLFITSDSISVLGGTIDALGTGVDGLQSASHVCVFIDKDRRPLINEQCEDRLNRMGQKETVLVYDLQCVKTLDEYIDKVNLLRTEDLKKILEVKA